MRERLREKDKRIADLEMALSNGAEVYTEPEVRRMLAEARIKAVERAQAQWLPRLTEFYSQAALVIEIISKIDTAAAVATDRRVLVEMLQGVDEELGRHAIRLERLRVGFGSPDLTQPLVGMVNLRIEAVQSFLSGRDNGERLRGVVLADGGDFVSRFLERLPESVDLGGRPQGMTEWRVWLAERWIEFERDNPEASSHDVRTAIVSELWDVEQRGGLDPDRLEALRRLRSWPHERVPDKRRKLLYDYKRNRS
jgi:hypothetical protein